jgi:hypothetical protein
MTKITFYKECSECPKTLITVCNGDCDNCLYKITPTINWWIRDLGDHYILMANDSLVSFFYDRDSLYKFIKQFNVPMEIK